MSLHVATQGGDHSDRVGRHVHTPHLGLLDVVIVGQVRNGDIHRLDQGAKGRVLISFVGTAKGFVGTDEVSRFKERLKLLSRVASDGPDADRDEVSVNRHVSSPFFVGGPDFGGLK
jgi:hypothetical protein